MSVGSQVADAMRKLSENRFEDAVVAASVALSATARLEYPTDGDKAPCRKFLEQSLPIISKIGWVSSVSRNLLTSGIDGLIPECPASVFEQCRTRCMTSYGARRFTRQDFPLTYSLRRSL